MPNLNVVYQRGNYALQTLTKEISALWGYPKRPYEFVTGYKAASNFTGHNADANGVVHGVDIFVGPGNLSEAQANVLTSFLRNEGLKGTIPGHPDRLYYIIYRDQIAGDFSNWEWVGAGYGHWDHVHISTCDLFWGDPAPISYLDYDSTASWGLSGGNTTQPQSGAVKPIKEDTLSAKEVETIINHINAVMIGGYTWQGKKHYGIGPILEETQKRLGAVPSKVWAATISRNGKIPVIQEVADSKTLGLENKAQLAALTAVVTQLASNAGTPVDFARIEDIVKASVKEGLADGVKVDVTVGGSE